jgi:hypothetical protein
MVNIWISPAIGGFDGEFQPELEFAIDRFRLSIMVHLLSSLSGKCNSKG